MKVEGKKLRSVKDSDQITVMERMDVYTMSEEKPLMLSVKG